MTQRNINYASNKPKITKDASIQRKYFKNINYLHTPQEWEDSLASGNVSLALMQMNLLLLMPPFMPSDGA